MALKLSTYLRNSMLGLEGLVDATISGGDGDTLAFVASTPGTITQATGSFITMGFVAGHSVKIIGATTGGNDQTAKLATVAALTLTFETGTTFSAEAFDDEAVLIASSGGSLKDLLRNGCLYIYSGSQPTDADAAFSGTQLVKITESSGAFSHGVETNGLEFDAPTGGYIEKCSEETWSGAGINSGTAGYFVLVGNPTDNVAADGSFLLPRVMGSIGTSGADLNLATTSISVGGTVTIDTFKLTLPAYYGA